MTTYYHNVRVHLTDEQQSHIIVFLAEYHTWITERWDRWGMESREYADTCYLLGNIEGRALHDGLTIEDLELIDSWEEEYNVAHSK